VAAGSFYHLKKDMLKKQIKSCFNHKLGPKKIKAGKVIGAVVPHAGYPYSGHVAAWVYSQLPKANYLIIGLNHSGFSPTFAVMPAGEWGTPLGSVEIDKTLVKKLLKNPLIEPDISAHETDHSIEVQLPFLQYRFGEKFKFVPLAISGSRPNFEFLEECVAVGKTIGKSLKTEKKKWIVLASSDFSHYVPHDYARATDEFVIESILRLDEKEFFSRIQERRASVCGFSSIAVTIAAVKELGAKAGKLLKYATSGDVLGDKSAVVGYASIVFS